jgi:hypothetical protein
MSARRATLRGDAQTMRLQRLEQDNKALRRRLTLMEQALQEARTARNPRPLPKPRRRLTTGDIVRVVVPDSHGSSIDPAAASAFLADVQTLDPHEVILMGDHVDCGGFLAQHHTLGFVAETEYSYTEDTEHAKAFLDGLQGAAGNATAWDYLEGNHEYRIERWCITETLRNRKDCETLRRALAPEFMLDLKGRSINYRRACECYDGLSLPGTIRRGACFFTHGFSTAKNAGDAHLRKIAGNICYAHTHRAQSWITTLTAVGTVAAHNGGCLCKLQPLWHHTDPTLWTHGYGVQFVDRRTGYFFHVNIPIVDGVSMFRPTLSPAYGQSAKRLHAA